MQESRKELAFEDLAPGQAFELGAITVSREDIIAFARAFDPQIFHIEDEPPPSPFSDGLTASGWHMCSLFMRLLDAGLLSQTRYAGSPGVEHLKWQRPMRPGDRMSGRTTVIDTRDWRADPALGLVVFAHELLNQHDECVMTMEAGILFARTAA